MPGWYIHTAGSSLVSQSLPRGPLGSGSSRFAGVYSGEKASSTFPGLVPVYKPYPDPTNNMPSAITDPAEPMDPPFARTPLTVAYSWAVSYSQIIRPSRV